MKECIELIWIATVVKLRNGLEYVRVVYRYYFNTIFRKTDLSLVIAYSFNSPFKISKQFLVKRRAKEVYCYGETPLTTMEKIADECRIQARDRVFELGCGRGRTCFWLSQWLGCDVVGIDYIPDFIHTAEDIASKFKLAHVEFRLEDFVKSDFTGASVIYFYGICYEESFIKNLIHRLKKLPEGTKIITISYPLEDYDDGEHFEIIKKFPASFNWGTADVYLQQLKRVFI